MSCSHKKRYQALPMYTYCRVGKPGNEATLVVQVTNIEVRSSSYQARFSMCSSQLRSWRVAVMHEILANSL